MNNNENEYISLSQKESSDDYYIIQNEELLLYINAISNKLNNIESIKEIKAIKKEINDALINITNIFEKLFIQNEIYESLLKKEEYKINKLYSDILHEKILKEILEEKIINFTKMQSDYELIKEKTGVIVYDGKIISDGRKDNEITILRTENSTLKKVITEKEKEIEKLKNEIKQYKANKNINTLFPTFSQKDFSNNNNFSATSRNFYKSYKLQTKLLNNPNNKTMERNSINKYFNSRENNTIIQQEKIISVNTNRFKKNKKLFSRNNCTNSFSLNNNYASCENILNKNKIKEKKIIKKKKVFYPMREFNSVRYINTQSISNKENISNNNGINCCNINNNKNQKKNVNVSIIAKKKNEDNKFKTYYDKFKVKLKK
jgi:hypothetical protein